MEKEKLLILVLLWASVAFWAVPLLVWLVRKIFARPHRLSGNGPGLSGVLVFSACLILSVWCLRYAVGYFKTLCPNPKDPTLTWLEEIFNSMAHAMQTFSMDEDYTEYIHDGKAMLGALLGEKSIWRDVYGLYAAVLNFVAPVAGGAVIFEILASIFPALRLGFAQLAVWKEKYYFSELNEASLELAKSICRIKRVFLFRPVLVFTDAYVDNEVEKSAELMLEAKRIGAICVRADLAHVKKNRLGRKKYFLIDRVKDSNLQTLAGLADRRNRKFLRKAEIYLFTEDDAYIQVERSVQKTLKEKWNKENDPRMPTFIPVRSHRNLISNMLVEVPLYEPLIGKEKSSDGIMDLSVTILGAGSIGLEMFLTTYWIGQLPDCRLTVNVVSRETETEFWDKIDYINPEIKKTMQKGNPLLQINRYGNMAPVYCRVNYFQCDVKSSAFFAQLQKDAQDTTLLDTDYFFVALGTDAENISVANAVRRYVGEYQLHKKPAHKAVIAYVVYASDVAAALNQDKWYSFAEGVNNIYMHAVGSHREVYSARLVFMSDYLAQAEKTHKAYISAQTRKKRATKHRKRLNNEYEYWSSLARTMHIKYKMYALGLFDQSLFDAGNQNEAAHWEQVKQAFAEYKKFATGDVPLPDAKAVEQYHARLHKMAWLEHRRWNAFMRSVGFRKPKDFRLYAALSGYKQMDLKLHPCLAECDQRGIRTPMEKNGRITSKKPSFTEGQEDLDMLDEQTKLVNEGKYADYDFKFYDYPSNDFEEEITPWETFISLIRSIPAKLFCRKTSCN